MPAVKRTISLWAPRLLLAMIVGLYTTLIVTLAFGDNRSSARGIGCDIGLVCFASEMEAFRPHQSQPRGWAWEGIAPWRRGADTVNSGPDTRLWKTFKRPVGQESRPRSS
jgi:hypothetical protein